MPNTHRYAHTPIYIHINAPSLRFNLMRNIKANSKIQKVNHSTSASQSSKECFSEPKISFSTAQLLPTKPTPKGISSDQKPSRGNAFLMGFVLSLLFRVASAPPSHLLPRCQVSTFLPPAITSFPLKFSREILGLRGCGFVWGSRPVESSQHFSGDTGPL